MSAQGIGFHEATVVTFRSDAGSVLICLDDVVLPHGEKSSGCLTLTGVASIKVDESPIDQLATPFDDGEVIFLECAGNSFSAVIQWNDFSSRTSVTKHYWIEFDSLYWVES